MIKTTLLALAAFALCAQTENPRLLKKIEPAFSEEARKAKWSGGEVRAKLLIDEKGDVASVQVTDHPGYNIDKQTEAALKQWKFKPAMKDGKPVKHEATVTVNFKSW